ncbi:MAG: hypothetical protein MMC33_010618 [Icmadophila ericetorum]|nr:hypothetical protein [Icmadophila ericetorum]
MSDIGEDVVWSPSPSSGVAEDTMYLPGADEMTDVEEARDTPSHKKKLRRRRGLQTELVPAMMTADTMKTVSQQNAFGSMRDGEQHLNTLQNAVNSDTAAKELVLKKFLLEHCKVKIERDQMKNYVDKITENPRSETAIKEEAHVKESEVEDKEDCGNETELEKIIGEMLEEETKNVFRGFQEELEHFTQEEIQRQMQASELFRDPSLPLLKKNSLPQSTRASSTAPGHDGEDKNATPPGRHRQFESRKTSKDAGHRYEEGEDLYGAGYRDLRTSNAFQQKAFPEIGFNPQISGHTPKPNNQRKSREALTYDRMYSVTAGDRAPYDSTMHSEYPAFSNEAQSSQFNGPNYQQSSEFNPNYPQSSTFANPNEPAFGPTGAGFAATSIPSRLPTYIPSRFENPFAANNLGQHFIPNYAQGHTAPHHNSTFVQNGPRKRQKTDSSAAGPHPRKRSEPQPFPDDFRPNHCSAYTRPPPFRGPLIHDYKPDIMGPIPQIPQRVSRRANRGSLQGNNLERHASDSSTRTPHTFTTTNLHSAYSIPRDFPKKEKWRNLIEKGANGEKERKRLVQVAED